MDKLIGIYKITSPTGRIYIGQSKNINKRFNSYKYYERDYKCYKNSNKKSLILNSLIKHGYNSHIFEILELCDEVDLNSREIFYIDFYKSNALIHPMLNGLNLHTGGNKPPLKTYITDESKEKISLKNKENHKLGKYKNVSKIIIKKDMSDNIITEYKSIKEMLKYEEFSDNFFRNNFSSYNVLLYSNFKFSFQNPEKFKYAINPDALNKIKKLSIIENKVLSSRQKTKTDDEIKNSRLRKSEKLSKAMLNKRSREEWSEYFKNINTGKNHSSRRPRSVTEKVLNHYNRLHKNNQKRIDQYNIDGSYIRTFDSLIEAAKSVDGKYQSLYRVCEGKRKTAYGFKWKWPTK